MRILALDGELEWSPFDIPGGNEPVRTATLTATREPRASTLVVSFPPGWERPAAGYYEAGEELVLLGGDLEMSGAQYRPGDWAWVPEGSVRVATRSRGGALALARWEGVPRWHHSDVPAVSVRGVALASLECTEKSPLGPGRALRRAAGVVSWRVDAPPPGTKAPVDAEMLELGTLRWALVLAGERLPEVRGPCFARIFE